MPTNFVVEFLIWMLIAASVIALLAARLRIPYTVALVLGGLAIGSISIHLPVLESLVSYRPNWLTPNVTLVIFLPPLLFEGSLKLQFLHLRENARPIFLLATVGVLVATLVTGFAAHWVLGLPILVALVFGAITAATDPISVLAIFKEMSVPLRLSVTVEGESLFNDGTAAVLYGILVAGVASGNLGLWKGVQEFFFEVLGGIALGGTLGYAITKLTQKVKALQVEITLSTVLAYSSYLLGQDLHVSGVIAAVAAGVTFGNLGTATMTPRTRIALWSFWEYFSFLVNSLLFLLIGLEVHVAEFLHAWRPTLLAVGAVLLGRVLSVYGLIPISNFFSFRIPLRWQHILVAGGIRGALALALALSLETTFPYRQQILAMTFGVVAVTIVFQGLSIKPLLRALGMTEVREDAYEIARVQQIAAASARSELDELMRTHVISIPAYNVLREQLDEQLEKAKTQVDEIYGKDASRIFPEIRMARMRLIAAERSSMEEAVHNGLISQVNANKMIETADEELDKLTQKDES
jgi:Na+:H+ antiporter